MPGLKIFQAIDQMPEMVNPQTGLVQPKETDLSVSEKQNFSNENVEHIRYDKGFLYDKAKDLQDKGIALGSNPEAVNDLLAEKQTNLGATVNALIKFGGKTAITVGDTLGGLLYIPSFLASGDITKLYDNDFHRWMDKQSENLDSALPIYATKAQEQEGFFSKLNNAKFWGDGVLGGMSFTVGAVLSEMALSALTASTFGAGATVQAAETATLLSRAKKIFGFFGKEADVLAYKTLAKDVVKSAAIGAGYEAGVEARNFLDTARKNYAEQYKQQYGVEPNAQQLAEADSDIKKTANLIFGANMALLSVDNFIQFKNIFGKGLSTDLKLFGKSAVDTEAKDLAKYYALRGTLNAAFDNTSKLRKAIYTTAKAIKNPLTEMNEEALQGEFQAIGQDYIKKKFDATAYDDSFSLIDSFSKNFKDTYGSEDAGIGFIIGAMGIPGMGIATGKTKNVKGFGNKIIASFEGGIAEAFEEQSQEKNAIKTAINQSSKVNIDNVQEQVKSNSAIYTSNKLRDEALENGDFFEAKNHEGDALFSFVKSRDNVGLLNESKDQYSAMIKDMDNATFAKEFGYDKLDVNERALNDAELTERKTKVIEQFNKRVDNFQETKDLASKVAPVRDFNDKDARLFNEAIHHLMYTTNDLDSREDSLVKTINNKLTKSKNDSVNNDRFKELTNFHNTWYDLTEGKLEKQIEEYNKNLNILQEESLIDVPTEDGLNSKKAKAEAKVKELKDTIQTKLDEINKNKEKLSKSGFNINNNFLNVDNFTQANNEFNALQKSIENHLGENIFDKDTINQSIEDLKKIQNKRKDLIAVYNHLNTKNGREKFDKEVKKNERNAKIEFLKIQARKFLHNQGLELDKDTVKEIENNVDLQVKETDSPEVKAQKEYIKKVSSVIEDETDLDILDSLQAHLKQYKEGVDDSLKIHVNTLIAKANQKIKDLKQTKDASEKQKIEDGKRPYFSNINELFSLFNNEQQKNKLASIANNPDEKDLRKRITFTLTDLENPKSIEQAVADLKEKDNQNVISLSGVRGNNKPFNFQMKVDGELIGGFQMPNQLYLKINDKWSPIDFSKLKEDGYLEIVLGMLFPSDLISTTEDRKVLGQYLTELNSFSNKLSTITQRGDISFEDFNNLTNGQINLNAFASQIEMNFTDDKDKDGNIIETKIEDTLDDPDNVLTKAATKTIKVNGEDKNIVIFGKSTGDGQGFSKLYFVNIINGKLERNEEGAVLWRDRDDKENSEERKAIQNLVKNKEKAINTKGSLFSLLVFNSNGYIQPIFTSNETISKLKGLDKNEEFIINFLNNEKALQPALQIISNGLSSYYEEHKDKTKDEFTYDDIKNFDLFLSVTGLNKTKKVKIIPCISTWSDKIGQLSFNLEINKKDNIIASSIYFDGQNFFKSFAKGKEELKPINEKFEKGEITLSQKIEEIKKFRHEVLNENKLNEEIASLILKDTQYSVLGKLRKETTVNATINGFYTNVLLNKNNQQSLENLVTKKKLGYNLYLRPDRTQVKEIISTKRNIEIRNEKQQEEVNQQQKAKEEIQNKEQEDLFKENTVKLEAQEEAKTIEQVVKSSPVPSVSNSDVTNANTAALSNLMNTSSIINEELLIQAAKNINLPAFFSNSVDRLKTALTTNEKLKAEYDKLNPQPIEVVDKKAALEPGKKQTPNIDKLEALGTNFEQLPKEEELLPRVYRRSKISEKGLSLEEFVQIVKDAQNEAEVEGANKLLELSTQDLIEYNTAIKNLAQILPIKTEDNPNGTIEVTDLIEILGNLKTKGEVGGRFIGKLKTIYLATKDGKSVKGFEYHEAFHAVFRMFLTDSQISKYLRLAEELYGTPNDTQLEELKNSSSDLIRLSKTQLKNIWLEEKMADAFMEHKVVPQSWLARLFNKIRAFINGIFNINQDTQLSNENAITQLFNDIYQGKFKNAKEKYPVIRNVDNVNKLLVQEYKLKLTNGKYIDKKGYLSYSISEAIINTITNEVAKILKDKGSKNITDDEISDIYDLFKERFNPNNEVIAELIDSIKDEDLANKIASKYLNVYKSLGNLKNQEIVVQEVWERLPLYNLVNESSILQEQVDDSDDLEDDELNDTGIVQKSKNEINHAWDKASKKVKQYISSVSTNIDLFGIGKPFDDYIVNDKSKNYNFAINGNHLYSNLTKMLVGAPAYKHLSLLHSVSNTSPEIKAFTHQWYKDIYSELRKNKNLELPEINVEDFSKLYEILSPLYYKVLTSSPTFSFISSDFEKNRTYLQDVLFSKEGVTRMLNANNRNVGKQVFSKWERNWNSKRIGNLEQAKIDFKENLYESNIDNILQKYVDLLENKKGLTSQNKSNAVISLVKTFKSSFSDLGIELPEQYIKYNLINFVFETGNTTLLTNEEIEWYNSFSASDIKPINLEFLDGIEKTLTTGISFGTNTIYNDINPITQQGESLLGAVGKLMDIAESTALFDTSIIPSSFNNQEGKRIFDITPPSDISRRLNILKDKDNVQLIKEYLQTRNAQEFKNKVLNNEENGTYYLYSFFTEEYQVDNFLQALDHNPLFNNVDIDTLFTTLTMAYAGGIRQEETNVTEYEDSEDVDVSSKNYGLFSDSDGKSYNNADTTAKILYRLSLLADSKFNKYNLKVIGEQKYAYYIASQYEGKSTVPMVLLPFNNFIEKGKINEKGLNSLYSIYNQEAERIKVVQNEIDNYYLGSKKDGYNEGFHYILQNIGVKGTNGNKSVKIFKHSSGNYFYLDIDNNNNVVNLSKEELYYNEKQEDGSSIKKEINLSSLTPKGLKLFNFANKNANLNEENLSEEEVKQRLSNFIDFQVDEYIKLLEDKGLLKEGEINLLPKSFISGNQLNKNVLKNAFLNDYLMSYSINSLLYGDNAESTKNSNDFVKRAGGMIGSGPNYGSDKTNIILLRSEVINKIDTTNAQTFNTPFHHLSVILNSKSIDNRIKEIYQGIDSGLNYYISKEIETDAYGNKVEVEKMKKITKEDYDYLYDNNAQHQPNKTQGFGIDWFLKTSISPILRETTSTLKNYSKENLKEALLLHKELFDLKLQALPSDNAYITFLTKKYQNLFKAIKGKEYKHNLLNELELNNAIAVYDSAWKRSKYNIHEISNGQPFLYKDNNGKKVISLISVPNASLIDQQKTDGVKKQITHPTQFLRLISTEQINETLVYFKNKEINVGTALNVYEKQLAERTDKGFKALKKEVLDENGDAEWDLLLKSFIDSIEKSSADPQQLELFQQGNSSKPKYNLNNPAIETKFQSMFLAFVSSNTLKQKVAGSKLSLMSSVGYELEREINSEGEIIKTFTTKQTKEDNKFESDKFISQRLRHDVYDKEKHEYYSEIVVSERFLRKFGYTANQFHKGEIPLEFLYISGVRIPTEDKHSMINCKIVDILPDSYGNAIMLPNEIVELSGADFDIDALYVRVNQTYTNVLNKKTGIYSSYLTQPTLEESKNQAYNEYLADSYDNNKISSTFNDLKTNNKELLKLAGEKTIAENNLKLAKKLPNVAIREKFVSTAVSELSTIINEIKSLELTLLEQSFDINKIIFNKEKWLEDNSKLIENNYNAYQSGDIGNINPLTKGETNNMLLELERKLINNLGNNKITNTPTSLKLFNKLIETLEGEGLINKDLGYGVHDMLSKTLADISISTGAANIGPVALFNNLFGILVKNKVTIERKVGEEINLEPFVNYSRDENNQVVNEKNAQRVQDSIATLLAAMTDNAKEQMANLFNLTTETLPVALAMIGVGHNFNNVMLLMKSPLVKKISELSQSYNKTIQSKQDYDDSKSKESIQQKIEKIFQIEEIKPFDENLDYKTLLEHLKYFNNSNLKSEDIQKTPTQAADKNQLQNIKKGVNELFEQNPELANAVYEALGFKEKYKNIERGNIINELKEITTPHLKEFADLFIQSNINIPLYYSKAQEYTYVIPDNTIIISKNSYGVIKHKSIIHELLHAGTSNKLLFDSDFKNQVNTIIRDIKETDQQGRIAFAYELESADEFISGLSEKSFVDYLKKAGLYDKVFSLVKDNISFEQGFKITSEQKQQALQLYSQYLDSLNKPNTNPILQGNQEEQVKKFAELQERLNNKEFLEGAKNAFESTPELQQFGTQEQYNDYIARVSLGIVKNPSSGGYNYTSKVKDIVYHGTRTKEEFEKFITEREYPIQLPHLKGKISKGSFFTKDKNIADVVGIRTITAILNMKNPLYRNKGSEYLFKEDVEDIQKNNDSLIAPGNKEEFIVFEPEQIHILGGKQDIEGFKEFISQVVDSGIDEGKKITTAVELENTKKEQDSQNEYYTQQSLLKRISNDYFEYKKVSSVLTNLQNLLQLVKGFKNTFSESEKFITALNNLGWGISSNGLDIVKNDKPTDKFYKNYKDTTKIIGNGVGDIFEKDKFLKQSIKTALALTKLSEKYFISQTPIAKKTREDILTLFKDYKAGNVDFQSNLRKHYLSYLTVMAYAESVKNSDEKIPKIEEFLLTPLEEIVKDPTKENNELQNAFLQIIDYNYKNGIKNDFLEFLEIKNIDYLKKQANKNTLFGYRFHGFGANSRSLKNPDIISSIISSFNDLYFAENNNIISNNPEEKRMNSIKTKFAKDMFKYLVVKDGLMFQNQSFIKAIDPILFTETSNSLDKVQELFSKMSSSKEYIETFGMSKEELNLDFIIKFGLNQNNYFDLKSQKIDVLRKTIDKEWIEKNKIESEDFVDDNESDTNEKEELVLEDNYPIFFDSKNNTLTINQFARITKGMSSQQKSQIKKENKKFILRDEIAIFKKIAKTYKVGDKIIPYNKIGFPIITYLSGKDSVRIPLKLTAVQDSIKVDGSWINFQISPEGKVLELSNSSKKSLKEDIYYGDLFNNTIYEIINNDAKLKTYKNGKEKLVNIAKAIANQFENGYIEGTKALYNQHVILGSGEISSLTNSIKDQLDMVLSPEQTEKVKMNMFNKTKEKAKDETEVRLNFINLINQYSAITKVTLEGTKNKTIEDLERVANNFMVKSGFTKEQIEKEIKKCYK